MINLKKYFLFFLFFFYFGIFCNVSVFGKSADSSRVFMEANNLYGKGEYSQAREKYEGIVKSSEKVPFEVFYNIGNCYFKEKKYAQSLLSFKKALRVSPRNKQAAYNLRFVRGMVQYKIDDSRKWYISLMDEYLSLFTIAEFLTVLNVILWITLFLIFINIYFSKRWLRWFLGYCTAGFILCLFFAGVKIVYDNKFSEAVVTVPETAVLNSPVETGTVAFRLKSGSEVFVVDKRPGWFKIVLLSGDDGWLSAADIELV